MTAAAKDWSGSKVEGAGDGGSRGRQSRKGTSSGGGGNFRVSNLVTKSSSPLGRQSHRSQ